MGTQIHIPRHALRGMLHLAGKHDVRFYLNGVFIEASPTETRVTATDGHLIGTFRMLTDSDARNVLPNGTDWAGILSRGTIEALPKPGKTDLPWCVLSDESGVLRIDNGAAAELLDGRFPEYRQSWPIKLDDDAPAQFNPELVRQFVKFARDGLQRRGAIVPLIRQRGDRAALVGFSDVPDFAGLLMPCSGLPPELPTWVADRYDAPRPAPQQAAA